MSRILRGMLWPVDARHSLQASRSAAICFPYKIYYELLKPAHAKHGAGRDVYSFLETKTIVSAPGTISIATHGGTDEFRILRWMLHSSTIRTSASTTFNRF